MNKSEYNKLDKEIKKEIARLKSMSGCEEIGNYEQDIHFNMYKRVNEAAGQELVEI